jgi:hypothetical protein
MASAIIFGELIYSGTPNADDVLAARYIVGIENKRLAALTPPGTPFPTNNAANLKASYISILIALITSAHSSYIAQARSAAGADLVFTDAEREQIRVNLITRLNGGESSASIVADTATL